MHNMQLLCPYYAKEYIKAMLNWQMYGRMIQIWAHWIGILKQLIKLLFHTFELLFRSKSQHGCPVSSTIRKLYFDLNIKVLAIGLKVI